MPDENKKTPTTTDAAARIQSSEATKSGTGQVESGKFASRLISAYLMFTIKLQRSHLTKNCWHILM